MMFAPAGVGRRHLSPAQAVVPGASNLSVAAPFGQGYLYVRSRERITQDGGRSLMAAPERSTIDPMLVNLESSATSANINLTTRLWLARQERSTASPDSHRSDSVPSSSPSACVWDSPPVVHAGGWDKNSASLPPNPGTLATETLVQPNVAQKLVEASSNVEPPPIPDSLPYSVAPAGSPVTRILPPLTPPRFEPLVTLLQKTGRMLRTHIGVELKKRQPPPYYGRLRPYLHDAVESGLVEIGGHGVQQWAQLKAPPRPIVPEEYVPLVDVLRNSLGDGHAWQPRGLIAERLYKKHPTACAGPFKRYVEGAEAAGIIHCDRKQDKIQLGINVP